MGTEDKPECEEEETNQESGRTMEVRVMEEFSSYHAVFLVNVTNLRIQN